MLVIVLVILLVLALKALLELCVSAINSADDSVSVNCIV